MSQEQSTHYIPPPHRCFLSPLHDHHQLLLNLNSSVVFQPLRQEAPPGHHLSQLLVSRYGGSTGDWQIRMVDSAFLIRAPNWLALQEFYLDEEFWGIYHFSILPWQTLDGSSPTCPKQRMAITMHDFPVDFCHPTYLRQATAAMGVLIGYAPGNLMEGNLAHIRILLESFDPSFIPPCVRIFHNDRVSLCPVTVEEYDLQDEQPPSPPPDLEDNWGEHPAAGVQVNAPPLYLPPWRRRIMRLPMPTIDPNRRLAPAATLGQKQRGCIKLEDGPGVSPTVPNNGSAMEQTRVPNGGLHLRMRQNTEGIIGWSLSSQHRIKAYKIPCGANTVHNLGIDKYPLKQPTSLNRHRTLAHRQSTAEKTKLSSPGKWTAHA